MFEFPAPIIRTHFVLATIKVPSPLARVSMRPVVSYDDITAPQNGSSKQLGLLPPSANQPPAKKRRISQHKASQKRVAQQHWDDPGNGTDAMTYGEDDSAYAVEEMEYEEEEEESRDLTHDEIWDDSALIEAWNSATAEYEVCGRNMKIMVSDGAS